MQRRIPSGHDPGIIFGLEIAFPIRSDQTLQNRLSLYQGLASGAPKINEAVLTEFYA